MFLFSIGPLRVYQDKWGKGTIFVFEAEGGLLYWCRCWREAAALVEQLHVERLHTIRREYATRARHRWQIQTTLNKGCKRGSTLRPLSRYSNRMGDRGFTDSALNENSPLFE